MKEKNPRAQEYEKLYSLYTYLENWSWQLWGTKINLQLLLLCDLLPYLQSFNLPQLPLVSLCPVGKATGFHKYLELTPGNQKL